MDNSTSSAYRQMSLDRWSPLPHGIDTDRVEAAHAVIDVGNVAVTKPTRSGFTTSIVIAAQRLSLKTLIVAPTRNILVQTVRSTINRVGGILCDIPGHRQCKYVQEIIKKDPLLNELPIPVNDCENCEKYLTCPITEIERKESFTTATITYAKLESVMLSSSDTASIIRDKLSCIDLVIFDEAHILSLPNLPQVDYEKYILIPAEYGTLKKAYDRWGIIREENREEARHIEYLTELHPEHYTGFPVSIFDRPQWYEQAKQWGQLLHFAIHRAVWYPDVDDEDILALRDLISIMSGKSATISYIYSDGIGRMVVTGSQGRNEQALKQFLTQVVPNAKVIFVSGTLIERRPGFFSDLSGRKIKTAIFPDLNNTNSRMYIHPSKWRFSSKGSKTKISRVIKEITTISESLGDRQIYLLAINARFAGKLKKALVGYPNIKVDYYRSSKSIGVAQQARICIAVGSAQLPRHVCDPLAEGSDDHERYFDSQSLRINAVDSATWQAWSRVKDPDGQVESHVYCIGVRAEEASRIVTWGTKREVKVELNDKGGIDPSVKCEKYLGRPNIVMEVRSDLRPCRRAITDYVDAVVPISDLVLARQKSYTFPYSNLIRETVRFSYGPLRLHNYPKSAEEFKQSFFALATLFVTRVDKCGLQWKHPDSRGKFGYCIGAPPRSFQVLMEDHLFGRETIALPPFDSADNCYYCAVDFDDHTGDTPQGDNVRRLTGFLRDQGLPCFVVKSGSYDGYHVFIPLIPTKTLTAYKFLNQLVKDAGLGDSKEIERYPKQKSASKYGNQIKLPLGFNWKAGKKSIVVDPYTLEQEESIDITHAIKLRDIPDLPEKAEDNPRKTLTAPKNLQPKNPQLDNHPSSEMRPCIKGVIEAKKQLEGGQGHKMRLAIAAEASHCGLSEEETVDLFRDQTDFNEEITTENVRYIWSNEYHKFKCETLQESCSSLVSGYCENCYLAIGKS